MELKVDFEKRGGILPVIVQDQDSGQILMQAYIKPESLEKTLKSGKAHFWSTSRNANWFKGETSGNYIAVSEVWTDCDRDSVLYIGKCLGAQGACHVDGWMSCFGHKFTHHLVQGGSSHPCFAQIINLKESTESAPTWSKVLADEEAMIKRKQDLSGLSAKMSHTVKSLRGPMARVAQKIGEEGLEVALALTDPDQDNQTVINEAADLLYRLQIGLVKAGINWSDVEAEIVRRRQ